LAAQFKRGWKSTYTGESLNLLPAKIEATDSNADIERRHNREDQ